MLQICETSDGNNGEDNEGCGDEVGVEPEYFQLADAAKDWKSSNNQSLGELVHGMFRWVHIPSLKTLSITVMYYMYMYVHVYMHLVYMYMYMCMYVHVHVYMHLVYMYMCMCIY